MTTAPLGGVGGRSTRYQITNVMPQQLGVIEAGSVLVNESAKTPIFVGDTSVTPETGVMIMPGNSATWQTTKQAYAIAGDSVGSTGMDEPYATLMVSNVVSHIDVVDRAPVTINQLEPDRFLDGNTLYILDDPNDYDSSATDLEISTKGSTTLILTLYNSGTYGGFAEIIGLAKSPNGDYFSTIGPSTVVYVPLGGRSTVYMPNTADTYTIFISNTGLMELSVTTSSLSYPSSVNYSIDPSGTVITSGTTGSVFTSVRNTARTSNNIYRVPLTLAQFESGPLMGSMMLSYDVDLSLNTSGLTETTDIYVGFGTFRLHSSATFVSPMKRYEIDNTISTLNVVDRVQVYYPPGTTMQNTGNTGSPFLAFYAFSSINNQSFDVTVENCMITNTPLG